MVQPVAKPFTTGTCRICLAEDQIEPSSRRTLANPLISPCHCNGTVKWVHQGCLARWRFESEGTAAEYTCEICHSRYAMRVVAPNFLSYIWSQWTPIEKYFYLLEFASIALSIFAAIKTSASAIDSRWRMNDILSQILGYRQPVVSDTAFVSSPMTSVLVVLLPKTAYRALRKLFVALYVWNHFFLPGHTMRSKVAFYLCTMLTVVAHWVLFLKWQSENADEILCDRDELEAESALEQLPLCIH